MYSTKTMSQRNMSLGLPPAGTFPNFGSRAPAADIAWAVNIVSLAFVLTTIVIRLYVKHFISKNRLAWDDILCIAALCLAVVHTGTILKHLDYGLGRQMHNIRTTTLTRNRLAIMTSTNLVVTINMFLVRLSLLGLYHRLFEVYEVSQKIYAGFICSTLIAIPEAAVAIGRMVKCDTLVEGVTIYYCDKRSTIIAVMSFALAACVLDVYIYSIPILRLRLLHVRRNRKVQLMVLFAMGFLAVLFSFVNFVFNAVNSETSEQLWYALWVAIFKTLEANIALTCACATFLPAFWKSIFSRSSPCTCQRNSENAKSSIPKDRRSHEALLEFHRCGISMPEPAHAKIQKSGRSQVHSV